MKRKDLRGTDIWPRRVWYQQAASSFSRRRSHGRSGLRACGLSNGDVEDVDGAAALGVDEDDVDIAGAAREDGGEAVEQAGTVVGDDLDEGGGLACGGVEANFGRDAGASWDRAAARRA